MATTAQEVRERAEFDDQMSRNVAKLMDFAKPYVGRLTPSDCELLLGWALTEAWARRATFAPRKASLLIWWDECLRAAADRQPYWNVIWYDNSVRAVASSKLGKGTL